MASQASTRQPLCTHWPVAFLCGLHHPRMYILNVDHTPAATRDWPPCRLLYVRAFLQQNSEHEFSISTGHTSHLALSHQVPVCPTVCTFHTKQLARQGSEHFSVIQTTPKQAMCKGHTLKCTLDYLSGQYFVWSGRRTRHACTLERCDMKHSLPCILTQKARHQSHLYESKGGYAIP